MYQIGLFSKMNHVTVKTLHHYDEIGLLKPASVDAENGYRLYSSAQTYTLHRINALKQLDFSLEEIKLILEGDPKEHFLSKRKAVLLEEIAKKTNQLMQIEYYLTRQEEKEIEPYEVMIKEIPAVIIASKRMIIDTHQDLFRVMPEMGQTMAELGCKCARPAYCFSLYHDGEYRETTIDVEICEAVTELKKDARGLTFRQIPRVGQAACVFHKGDYQNFPKAYLALSHWMENNGYEPADLPRESYIDGVWNQQDKADWLTEIQFPVKKKAGTV